MNPIPQTFTITTKELFNSKDNPTGKMGVEEAWKIKQKNLPKFTGKKDKDGNFILPESDGKKIIRIQKLGEKTGVMWCDFEQVPQGYVHVCGTCLKKPKGARNTKTSTIHLNGYLINPTDDQIIEYGKRMMNSRDMYDQSSGKNPDDFIWIVENKK